MQLLTATSRSGCNYYTRADATESSGWSLVQCKMGLKARRFLTRNGPEGEVGGGCRGVIISMENAGKLSREQIERLLEASQEIRFEGKDRGAMYQWITQTLTRQRYREQGKPMRGLRLRYVEKLTGRSRTQVTRLMLIEPW